MHFPDEPLGLARFHFLRRSAQLVPELVEDLASVPVSSCIVDSSALERWAVRWRLTPAWCLAGARATREGWARYILHPDGLPYGDRLVPPRHRHWMDGDTAGGFVDGPRNVPIVVKDPEHFDWLIRAHVQGAKLQHVAAEVGREWTTVRDACRTLAEFLDLPFLTRRGRPRRGHARNPLIS